MQLAQTAEKVGASWITVHGRTTKQRAEPVNMDAIKLVKQDLESLLPFHLLVCVCVCVCVGEGECVCASDSQWGRQDNG